MVVFWKAMASTYITCNMNALSCSVFENRHCILLYIGVVRCDNAKVEVFIWPPRPLLHDGWWSFSVRPRPQLISPAIWMLRAARYFRNVTVYSGISLLGYVNNAKLGYLWVPLDCCGTMADGRFLRGHGLNLYHLQYECFGMLSIWVTSL